MMAWLMKWLFDPGNTQTNSPDDIQKDGASSQETSNDIKRYKIDKCYALLTGADINPSSRTSLPTLGFVHKDLQRMNNVLRELGFDVSNPCLGRETDVSREFLFDKCINNPSRDLAQSCSLFYFSGHGDKEKVLLSNGESATYVDIILNFNCSSADAPRIFIFDCCCDAPSEGVTPELSLLDNIQPHVLVVFACMPDDITYGNKKNGSYFTHKLENRLRAFVNELSFVEIILQVTGTEVIKEGTRQREYELNPFVVCSLRQQLHFGGRFVLRRPLFASKEEVLKHISTIGHGVSVLVCYSPDPRSAKDRESQTETPQVKRQIIRDTRRRVGGLACRLEQLGFSVFTDLLKGGENPDQLLKWYSNHIQRDNWIILVCSPAFEELFRVQKLEGSSDWQDKLVYSYCNNIYCHLVHNPDVRKKFIPLVFQPQHACSVPSLFQGSFSYCITEDKAFNYDSSPSDLGFDALVCRMAGIDREEIERKSIRGQIQPVAGEGGMHMGDPEPDISSLFTLKPGYKFVSPQELSEAPQIPRLQLSEVVPRPQGPSPPIHQTTPTIGPHPSGAQTTPTIGPHPPGASAGARALGAANAALAGLPPLPVNQKVFIWLSRNIVQWKFLARYLRVSESDIIAIEHSESGDLQEQCYQMLLLWNRQHPQGTYRDIGAAMAESSKNCHLLDGFAAAVQMVLDSAEV